MTGVKGAAQSKMGSPEQGRAGPALLVIAMFLLLGVSACTRPGPSRPFYVADGGGDRILRMAALDGSDLAAFGSTGSGEGQFRQPSDVTVDAQGRIYVVDRLNRRLVRMDDMTGRGWKVLGGPDDPLFEDPLRVAIHPVSGDVFVTDFARGRVLRFPPSLEGAPKQYDDNSETMQKPSDLAFDRRGRMYVTNDESCRLLRISDLEDLHGRRGTWEVYDAASVPGPFPGMRGMGAVAVGPDDHVYLVSMAGDNVVRLESDLTGAVPFGRRGSGRGEFYNPRDLTFDDQGRLVVVDSGNNRLVRMDDMEGRGWTEFRPGLDRPWSCQWSGALLTRLDGPAPRPSPIPFVTEIYDAADPGRIGDEQERDEGAPARPPRRPPPGLRPGSYLVVADCLNHRLVFLSRDRRGRCTFQSLGSKGTGPRHFNLPCGMAVDHHGRLVVVDADNRRLVRIDDPSGAGWTTYRSIGGENDQEPADPSVPRWFDLVDSVAVHPRTGQIFFSDTNNHRIVRLDDMDGSGWALYFEGGRRFRAPAGLAFGPDEALYAVTTDVEYRLVRIADLEDFEGRTWEYYDGADVSPLPGMRDASGVVVGGDGTIYVSDPSTDRVLAVEPDLSTARPFGSFGVVDPGRLFGPLGMALSPTGLLAMVDSGNNRVVMVDPRRSRGDHLANWWEVGAPGAGDWRFRSPSHVCFWTPGRRAQASRIRPRAEEEDHHGGAAGAAGETAAFPPERR